MPHVIIVVPCFNEEKRLAIEEMLEFRLTGHRLELLFVNDGSTDGTLATLQGMAARAPDRLEVLDLQPNRGKAEAVRHGILRAAEKSPDYVGFWDADLATPLVEIQLFCDVLQSRPDVDMVFGSRVKLLGRTIERKVYRHYFGRVFATAVSAMLSLPIYDSQCGAKLFRVSRVMRQAFADPFLSRWVFDVEIIARFKNLYAERGIDVASRIYELPLREWRDVHGSKLKLKDALRAYTDLAKIRDAYVAR